MINVNQIASWFTQNNIRLSNTKFDNHLLFMCLLAKVALHIKNIEISSGKITYENGYLNFSEYLDKNAEFDFNEKETHILRSINKYYGYYTFDELLCNYWIEDFLMNICSENTILTDVMVYASLTPTVSRALQFYQHSNLDEYVIVEEDRTFFVEKGVELTEEEEQEVRKFKHSDQKLFNVFRDEESLVIM